MRPLFLCLLCLASLAPGLYAEPDPAYAILLQRVLSSLPTMIQTQLDGNPEQAERILTKILGDGLLGKLLSDPIQMAQRFGVGSGLANRTDTEEQENLLWSSITGTAWGGDGSKKGKSKGESNPSTVPPTPASPVTPSPASGVTLPSGQSGAIDEKALAEALLEALKKKITPTPSIPSSAQYGSSVPLSSIDFSTDGNNAEYSLHARPDVEFRRAPASQRYGYGLKYSPTEQQVLDDVNRDAVLAYANALRSQQAAFLANQQPAVQPLKQSDLSWLTQPQRPVVSQASQLGGSNAADTLTPEEATRMHEILDAYDAKLGRRLRFPIKWERFPDATTVATDSIEAYSVAAPTAVESVDASETLASVFKIPGQQLAQIDSECGCVPVDLEMMQGDWVQALGNTENVMRIYKGALHLMQEFNKVDIKPTCARFKFESASTGRNTQEANMNWTFKTSETSKPLTLEGTVVATDHRTMQLQMEGPNSYKFNLPVCAQKTGMSEDGSRYSYVVLAETVGKDKCRSAHVLVRNSAAFFHERNEELINFLKTRIESDNMKPVSVVPFGKNCD